MSCRKGWRKSFDLQPGGNYPESVQRRVMNMSKYCLALFVLAVVLVSGRL